MPWCEASLDNYKGIKNLTTTKLVRQLSLFDSSMIMMGIVIGSGIFVTTGIMAQSIPSVPLLLLAWIVGGLLTLAGALTYAELGAAMPQAGGQYVYLREAYGSLFGFLFGWILFLVYMTGGIAGLAAAFSEYFGIFFPSLSTNVTIFSKTLKIFDVTFTYTVSAGQLVAMAVIILLSAVNFVGLLLGKIIQNVFTVIKIGTLISFILFGFTIGKTTPIDFSVNPVGISFSQLFVGFGIALIAVFWAFDGWNNINFVAGEIKNPKRNLPLALIFGTLGITIMYVLINIVYLFALPLNQLTGEVKIAEKASSILFGDFTTTIISVAVIISIFGSINGSILAGPRVYYAMAKDGMFFKKVARVHPKFKVPGFAILVQAIWSCFLVLSGNFEQLITYTMFISFVFWIAATASVFKLRKKYPNHPRPYKTWGYPVVPIIFIVATSGILFNTLIEKPLESLAGVAITLIGIPVYYFWKKKMK
jgi:basic amino acid/polyamine antiporter, APA family